MPRPGRLDWEIVNMRRKKILIRMMLAVFASLAHLAAAQTQPIAAAAAAPVAATQPAALAATASATPALAAGAVPAVRPLAALPYTPSLEPRFMDRSICPLMLWSSSPRNTAGT